MIKIDTETQLTNRPGVFAGGDVVTGPNTVIDAVAAGKKAAVMIDRYVRDESLRQPPSGGCRPSTCRPAAGRAGGVGGPRSGAAPSWRSAAGASPRSR